MNGFYGNYRGEVVRTDDPTKSGRVKINVFGVYDGLAEDELPWAIYADSFMGGSNTSGGIIVPEIGAHVWCFFEGGNHHLPVYWAGAPAMKDGVPDIPEESRAKENQYPFNKVFKTAGGFVIELDDMDGEERFRFYHPAGNEQIIDFEGNTSQTVAGNTSETVAGNKNSGVEGSVTTDAGGSVTLTAGGNITIDSGGSVITISNGGDIEIVSAGNVVVSGTMIMLN